MISMNKKNKNNLWCTFSPDQIDLNFKDPIVLIQFIEIIFLLLSKGITIFRLDAVAFIWKKHATTCVNLLETHEIVKLLRLIINYVNPSALIVTETNLPKKENLSYFGNKDEANWIYNFPLPPLILHTFLFVFCFNLDILELCVDLQELEQYLDLSDFTTFLHSSLAHST